MKNNKKGFTLIELLAVIVILAILVMLAIPAVTRYLTTARKSAYSDNALRAVEAVRSDIVSAGFASSGLTGASSRRCANGICYYNKDAIDELLENKFSSSSFGNEYACVGITVNQSNNTYTMWMADKGTNGFVRLKADEIDQKNVGITKVKGRESDSASITELDSYTCPSNTVGTETINYSVS